MGSKGSTTQNTTQTYNPAGSSYLTGALQTAQNAAQTPFQNYSGQLVAPVNQQQNLGISGVNQYANAAQPYIGDAANYINAGAASPAGNISQFLNPYTQQVVDATQNQFNQSNKIQQSQLLGNAASMGALGGDRSAIAQSELAKQQNLAQNPVIAGLYSQGFNTALGAAQNYGQQQLSAGYGLGSLGTAAQTAGLQGATQQIGAGSLQQQTSQAQNQAQYNEFLRQAGYPFQASQFLTQATSSLAPSLGGTQQGYSQTTPAQPSLLGQIAGLGLAGAGIYNGFGGNKGSTGGTKGSTGGGTQTGSLPSAPQFGNYGGIQYPIFNRGGAVNGDTTPQYANGGPVAGLSLLDHILPMVDAIRTHRERGGPILNTRQDANGVFIPQGFADGGGIARLPKATVAPLPIRDAAHLNSLINNAEGDDDLAAIHRRAQAQGLSTAHIPALRGFADGGAPDFNAAFQQFAVPPDNTDPNRALAEGMINKFLPEGAIELNAGAPIPRPRPPEADAPAGFALPPQFTQDEPPLPGDAMAFSGGPGNGSSAAPQAPSGIAPEGNQWAPIIQSAIRDLQQKRQPSASASPWNALTAAGLGILASGSPFPGVAIGKGGLEGLGSLERQQAAERQNAAQQAQQSAQVGNLAIHGLTAEQAAQRLLQESQRHASELAERTRHNVATESVPRVIGRDQYGLPIYGAPDATGKVVPTQPQTKTQFGTGAELKPPTPPPAQISTADDALPPNAGLVSGDDAFLLGLPEKDQKMVKAMVEGRQPPPPAKALATPYWQRYVELANQYDPAFDMGRWQARVQTRKNFATGVEGRTIRSLNTVANHIGELDEAGKALDNFKQNSLGTTKPLNTVMNWYRENAGDPRITRFDTTANAVSTELEKAFRGNQTAISGIKEWRKSMAHTMSPEQMQESNKTLTKLLMGQLEGLTGQYNSGMGTNADPLTILQPKAAAVFKRLLGDNAQMAPAGRPQEPGAPAAAAPTPGPPQRPGSVPEGSQYSPSRKAWRDPSGRIYDAQGNPVQ